MVEWINSFRPVIIESGNWAFALGWIILGSYVAWRQSVNHLSDGNHAILNGIGWMALGSGASAIWFSVSRHLAEPGEQWNMVMFGLRHYAVAITAIVFVWGATGALAEFLDWDQYRRIAMFFGIVVVSSIFGVL